MCASRCPASRLERDRRHHQPEDSLIVESIVGRSVGIADEFQRHPPVDDIAFHYCDDHLDGGTTEFQRSGGETLSNEDLRSRRCRPRRPDPQSKSSRSGRDRDCRPRLEPHALPGISKDLAPESAINLDAHRTTAPRLRHLNGPRLPIFDHPHVKKLDGQRTIVPSPRRIAAGKEDRDRRQRRPACPSD